MAKTLKQIFQASVYDLSTQKWVEGVFPSTSELTTRPDGTAIETTLASIPTAIEEAVTILKGGVATDGDTLAKLLSKITAIQTALESDDTTLDTLQEVVDYVKSNKEALLLLGQDKVDYDDIVNDLTAVVEGKVLDARQGKALKDLIDALQTAVTALETQATTFATITALNAVASAAIPVVSETAPVNPVDKQYWFKPAGTVEIGTDD